MQQNRAQRAAMALRTGAKPYGIDLTAPGGVEALLARHRSVFGDAKMTADPADAGGGTGGAGGGDGGQGGGGAGTGGTGGGGAGTGGSGGGGDGGTERPARGGDEQLRTDLARERDRRQNVERELQQLRDADEQRRRADEGEQARQVRTELEQQLGQSTEQVGNLRAALILRDARDAATAAGVPAEHWRAFSKHVDLEALTAKIGADGTVPEADLTAAVEAALEEAPVFRTTSTPRGRSAAPGSGAGAARTHDDVSTATASALARMRAHLGHPVTDGAS
jgi:hypothetical protein